MRTRTLIVAIFAVASAAASFGCGANADAVAAEPWTGTAVQRWTIQGTTDPSLCVRYRAATMRIIIYDLGSTIQASALTPCEEFQTEHIVRAQIYTGIATFLDAAGQPVSDTLQIAPFTVAEGQPTAVAIDFPVSTLAPR